MQSGDYPTAIESSRNSETQKSAKTPVSFEFMSFGFNPNILFRLAFLNSMAVSDYPFPVVITPRLAIHSFAPVSALCYSERDNASFAISYNLAAP
jgi:hypothetical protein